MTDRFVEEDSRVPSGEHDRELAGWGLDGIEHRNGYVGGFPGVVFGGLAIEKL